MKIASWNVNSLQVRLPQVIAGLSRHQPDIPGLQEIKVSNAEFLTKPLKKLAIRHYFETDSKLA
jgi:exodeoxyribonuclease-3